MSEAYAMPSLGSGMTEGTVLEWRVEPGSAVRRGEVVGVVDTDKGAIELEIWEDAQIAEILVSPGTRVPVGTPLLRLQGGDQTSPLAPAVEAREVDVPSLEGGVEAPWDPPTPDFETPSETPPRTPSETPRIRASPLARRKAEERGISLAGLRGTGPGGAITDADLPSGGAAQPRRPPEGAPDAMRRAIAAAMSRSKREIPHFYLGTTVPVHRLVAWLAEANRDRAPADRILGVAVYLKALARALHAFPEFNGFWEGEAVRPVAEIRPALVVSLRGGGLVAPAMEDPRDAPLPLLSRSVLDLVTRARTGRLRSSEISDSTITLTDLGERGVEEVYGVIYPPQVALVGVGAIVERPWAEEGRVESRSTLRLTLSADHRASDGHRGGLFLRQIGEILQQPELL